MRSKLTRRQRLRIQTIAVAGAVLVVAGGVAFFVAGGSSTSSVPALARTVRHVAEPAGPTPSESAQMVCAPEAQQELATALGVSATSVTTPTWVDHLYSCQYVYPSGVMPVSVKELSSGAETTAYFDSLQAQYGRSESLKDVAQGAFVTANGSLVLRKDYKVLFVDTSALSVPFGSGYKTRSQVAVGVGITVLGCWTGA